MKKIVSLIILLFLLGCVFEESPTQENLGKDQIDTFKAIIEQTSLTLTEDEVTHLNEALNAPVLEDYYKEAKDTLLDRDFEIHARTHWSELDNLNSINNTPFQLQATDSITLETQITAIVPSGKDKLVLLYMIPADRSGWSCGSCPGISFILKYENKGSYFDLIGRTGKVPYSFKYGLEITRFEIVERSKNSYLLVTTDAGGIGQGREGVTLYSMEPFGSIIFSKIFINGYRGVYFLPQDYNKIAWVIDELQIDTNQITPREIHVNADIDINYKMSLDMDTVTIKRTGLLDYLVYWRDPLDYKAYKGDTVRLRSYEKIFHLNTLQL